MQLSSLRTSSSASLMDLGEDFAQHFEDATLPAPNVALTPTPSDANDSMDFDVPILVATPEAIDALLFVGVQLTTPDPRLQAIDPRLTHFDPYLCSAPPAFINSAGFPIAFLRRGSHEKSAAGSTPDEILGVALSSGEPGSRSDTQPDAENPNFMCDMGTSDHISSRLRSNTFGTRRVWSPPRNRSPRKARSKGKDRDDEARATSRPIVIYPAPVEYEPTIDGLSAADIVAKAQEYNRTNDDNASYIYPMKTHLDARYLPLPANKEFLDQFHGPGRSVYSNGIESMSTAIPSGGPVGSSGALKLDNEKLAISDSESKYGCAVKGNADDRAVKAYLAGKNTKSLILVIPCDPALAANEQKDKEHIAWLKERMKHIIKEFELTSMAEEEEELVQSLKLEQLLDRSLWEGSEPYYSPLGPKKHVTVEITKVDTVIAQMMGVAKDVNKHTFKSKRFSTAVGRAELELLALWKKKMRMNAAKKRAEEHRQCPVTLMAKEMQRKMVL